MNKLGRMFLLLALAVAVLSVTGCASRTALDEAQKSLTAATQRVGTLEEQLKASQAALTTAQGDLTKAQKDIATLTSDATTLKGTLTATQSDVASAKRELSSVGSDLTALENSVSLTRADVTTVKGDLTKVQTDVAKLTTTDPVERRTQAALRVLNLWFAATNMAFQTDFLTAAARVGDLVKSMDDNALTNAWNATYADELSVVATAPNTAARDAAIQKYGTSRDVFLSRLLQLIRPSP